MENLEIARILEQMADLLEIQDANPFRVRAYRNAARTVGSHAVPIRQMVEQGEDVTTLPGIGKDLGEHLRELVSTGRLRRLDELAAAVPRTLIEVMALPGVGPKKARRMWQELDVKTLDELERAAGDGRVAALSGFGAKSEQRILDGIRRLRERSGRVRLDEADRQVRPLVELLNGLPGVERLEVAGSYRRRCETVGDLDLLAVARRSGPVMEAFTSYERVERVEMAGDTRGSVVLDSGLQVDLRIVPRASYGAALVYFTGSKEHNIKLRQRALDRKLRLSEYGLFREPEGRAGRAAEADPRTGKRVAGREEADVYRKLGLPWIPPELREDRGEVEAAAAGELPALVETGDLRGDLQMHTNWSDGKNTVEEMVAASEARGYQYLAITDHSPALAMTGGLDARRLRQQRAEIEKVQERHPGLRILRSQEVDILTDGSLDADDETLESLDLVVVAVHSRFDLPEAKQTVRLIRALSHPGVHVLAHPTARRIGKRRGLAFDLDEVLHCALEHGVAVELNSLPERLDLPDTQLMRARELGVGIVISTDAHRVEHLGLISYGVEQARRAWLTREDVLNTRPLDQLLERLTRR